MFISSIPVYNWKKKKARTANDNNKYMSDEALDNYCSTPIIPLTFPIPATICH